MFRNIFNNNTVERTPEQQTAIDEQTKSLALYHFDSCPFCMRVRNGIDAMSLNIERRNIHQDRQHFEDLLRGGGKTQVPALQITHEDGRVEWMYESMDILNYLKQRFD